ncbi:MAG TPA: AAA family ATPase [Desulfuromonadales bacterium]|nr:AAA family ATPase [Desulfuromonadales bacterium]
MSTPHQLAAAEIARKQGYQTKYILQSARKGDCLEYVRTEVWPAAWGEPKLSVNGRPTVSTDTMPPPAADIDHTENLTGKDAGVPFFVSDYADQVVKFSLIKSVWDNRPVAMGKTWGKFINEFHTPVVRGRLPHSEYLAAEKSIRDRQKDGAAIITGLYSQIDTRDQDALTEYYIQTLDIDESTKTFDEVCAVLDGLGFEVVIHTSYSHSIDKPKYRAYILLSAPITEDIKPTLERIIDFFDARVGNIDPACRKPGQLYFTPAVPPGGEPFYQCRHLSGIPLDPTDFPALPAGIRAVSQSASSLLSTDDRPGDDYNRRGSWADIMLPLGHRPFYQSGDKQHWTRNGKRHGVSFTVFTGSNNLYCHTSAAEAYPFEGGKSYSLLYAYALVNHGGDIKAAVKDLASQGYGTPASSVNSAPTSSTAFEIAPVTENQEVESPFISGADMLVQPLEVKTLLGGVIEPESTGQLFGPSGGGKTFVALDMALSIATGTDWNGTPCEQGIVLYYAGEGHRGLRRRVKAWWLHNGKPDLSDLHVSRQAVPFDKSSLAPSVLKAIELAEQSGKKVKLIIVDTLARHLIGDENATKDMSEFVNIADRLREAFPGSTVMIVHHTGNSAEATGRSRGSSALKAACDFEIQCDKGLLTYTKLKDAEQPPPVEFKLMPVVISADADGGEITSCVVQYGERSAKNRAPVFTSQEKIIVRLLEEYPEGILIGDLRQGFSEYRQKIDPDVKSNTVKNAYLKSLQNLLDKQVILQNGNLITFPAANPSSVILPSFSYTNDACSIPSSVISPYKGDDEMTLTGDGIILSDDDFIISGVSA